MNPEYMLGLAERRLGASQAQVVQARTQLAAGLFLAALVTLRFWSTVARSQSLTSAK